MAEKTTQFLFWAAAKSPLILSTDISQLTQEEINLLQNPAVLAINQDDLGKPITLRKRYPDDMDVWAGPLGDGSKVATIINWSDKDTQKTLKLEDLGFSSGYLNEVLTGKPLQTLDGKYGFDVPVHGSLLVRITEGQLAPQPNFKRFPVKLAELSGGAYIKQLNTGVKVATEVATGLKPKHKGGLLWKDIPSSLNDETLVSFEYINPQLSPENMDNSKLNFKHVPLVINNNQVFYLDFPISGKLWEKPSTGFLALLPLQDGLNTILIQGEGDWALDFIVQNFNLGSMKDAALCWNNKLGTRSRKRSLNAGYSSIEFPQNKRVVCEIRSCVNDAIDLNDHDPRSSNSNSSISNSPLIDLVDRILYPPVSGESCSSVKTYLYFFPKFCKD
ncbi:hypothetical protein Pst134EB_020575 [Puccinia striiformis f. sp. tritici]|nr:hypothetical protein Pst134EB_020575 [Puccinia striiformis f. sp. tritici]